MVQGQTNFTGYDAIAVGRMNNQLAWSTCLVAVRYRDRILNKCLLLGIVGLLRFFPKQSRMLFAVACVMTAAEEVGQPRSLHLTSSGSLASFPGAGRNGRRRPSAMRHEFRAFALILKPGRRDCGSCKAVPGRCRSDRPSSDRGGSIYASSTCAGHSFCSSRGFHAILSEASLMAHLSPPPGSAGTCDCGPRRKRTSESTFRQRERLG